MFLRMLPYVWHSLIHSRARSLLIILGVAVAVYVIASLQTTIQSLDQPRSDRESERILNVREAARSNVMAGHLPENFERRIADIPGVQGATGVLYQMTNLGSKKRMHAFIRGVDPKRYLEVHHVPILPEHWRRFIETSNAAVVGSTIMEHMEWKIGDVIELPRLKINLQIAGVIPPENIELSKQMLIHRKLLQVAREKEGRISYVLVSPAEKSDPMRLAEDIDAAMQMTPVPTKTVSAAAYAEASIRKYRGFVNYLKTIRWIVIAITILGATNAIGISIRQRTRELGILKAIGLFPWLISSLVIAEAVLLSLMGGLLGLGAALFLAKGLSVNASVAVFALSMSGLIGFLGGLAPALSASGLHIVDALNTLD